MAYPSSIDSYSPVAGTTLLSAGHAGTHNQVGSAMVAIETALGTTAAVGALTAFTSTDKAVRISTSGGTLQQSINGTINNSVIGTSLINGGTVGTALVQGGTANNQAIGTPVVNGGTVTRKTLQGTGNSELFQSGIGTISGTALWTNDTNTATYYKNGTITFPVAYSVAPNLVANPTNDSLQTGCFAQVLTPIGTAVGTVRISISTFNPSAAAQTFYWMAHGTI